MTISTIAKSSLKISYGLFFVALVTLFALLAISSRSKFDPNPVPFGFVFAVAFIWQVFTLCFHRHHFLTWILTVLYAIPAAMFFIYVLRAVA